MSMIAAAASSSPDYLTFVGALVVLIGTVVVLMGALRDMGGLPGEKGFVAVGNAIIGTGLAVSFVGLTRSVTTAELIALACTLVLLVIAVPFAARIKRLPSAHRISKRIQRKPNT
ncbi:MAG TPA: hypothetical protein VK691_01020 [Solirubrobacteraceae bacterium]|jgi:hypothetical protein|nr:hypothetical protein [Solirubrobacteraceae bacterium]